MKRAWTVACVVLLEMIRRKDIYVLAILMGALLALLVSMDVFGLGGAAAYVADIGLLATWVCTWFLAVTVSTRQLPQEESRGTVYALLAKPVTRLELIAGKWAGATLSVVVAMLALYALVFVVTILKGGQVDLLTGGEMCLLHGVAIGVMAAIGLAASTRLNHDAAATLTFVLTGAALLVAPRIPAFVAQSGGVRAGLLLFLYNVLPHFEVFDLRMRFVHRFGPVGPGVLALSAAYGAALTAAFLALAWAAYRNKRFTRGTLSGY